MGLLISLAIGYLVYGATRSTRVYYFNVSELLNQKKITGETVRVNGQVMDGSIVREKKTYKFVITDGKGNIPVVYHNVLPDTFKPGRDIILEGIYKRNGTFKANKVMARCPSKYEEK